MLTSNFVNWRVSSASEGFPHQSTQRLPNPVPFTSKNLPVASYYPFLLCLLICSFLQAKSVLRSKSSAHLSMSHDDLPSANDCQSCILNVGKNILVPSRRCTHHTLCGNKIQEGQEEKITSQMSLTGIWGHFPERSLMVRSNSTFVSYMFCLLYFGAQSPAFRG
jgi:hypothetical protein